jgi:hypothetical protein
MLVTFAHGAILAVSAPLRGTGGCIGDNVREDVHTLSP